MITDKTKRYMGTKSDYAGTEEINGILKEFHSEWLSYADARKEFADTWDDTYELLKKKIIKAYNKDVWSSFTSEFFRADPGVRQNASFISQKLQAALEENDL